MERTLVLIKPDGVVRGLVGEILSRLEKRGLKLIALKMLKPDRELAESLYAVHQGKSFYEGLVEFISSGPVVAAIFEGRGAVAVVRRVMGETDPVRAQPGTIRGDLALDISHNLIHGSDSLESAEKEIPLFFSRNEILQYNKSLY